MALKSLTLKNYRSIGSKGATIPLDQEFVGIVGVNNSGKSSVLRAFWEIRPILNWIASNEIGDQNLIQGFTENRSASTPGLQLLPGERVQMNGSAMYPEIVIQFKPNDTPDVADIDELKLIFLDQNGRNIRFELVQAGGANISNVETMHTVHYNGRTHYKSAKDGISYPHTDWLAIQDDLKSLASSLYIGSARNTISASGARTYDISIGKDFVDEFAEYQTGSSSGYEANEAVDRMTNGIKEIFGIDRLSINAARDGTLQYLINGTSFRGSELGSGIGQFVIVAINTLVKKPAFLLIDEPELNLHASLQLKFLTLLAQNTSKSVIFASHSIGLVRSVADSILVASRNKNGESSVQPYRAEKNLSLTLGELGYGGFHDEAYNAVLLVEGVTDVRVFQELLSKFGVRNEVVIVPLGGGSMAMGGRGAELAELQKLSKKVFAVVDSERKSSAHNPIKERRDFKADCVKQGIDCHVVDRRSTENYLNRSAGVSVMGLPSGTTFGNFDHAPSGWAKEKNWRVAQMTSLSEIKGTDLGKFLAKIAKASKIK
jgi:energy-coupling factor transporter ATP-binding protein EcfA2